MQEPCQPLLLVGLEHMHSDHRPAQHDRGCDRTDRRQSSEVLPGGARGEQSHKPDRHEHHARAQVRLGYDQERREQRKQHDPHRRAPFVQPPRAVDDEAGE